MRCIVWYLDLLSQYSLPDRPPPSAATTVPPPIRKAVKPFSRALLGTLFLGWLFRLLLSIGEVSSYIAGLILLAAAPCTAMVFVCSNLCEAEPAYTLSHVALNDVIIVFAFAPLVGLLLGVASITVSWDTLLISVMLYIVVPVVVAQVIRSAVIG